MDTMSTPHFDYTTDPDGLRAVATAAVIETDPKLRDQVFVYLDWMLEAIDDKGEDAMLPDMLYQGFWYRPRILKRSVQVLICELQEDPPKGFEVLLNGNVRLPDGTERPMRCMFLLEQGVTPEDYYAIPDPSHEY